MVIIVFESHATTLDNETGLSSGWFDVELSELGKRQAQELGERRKDEHFDAIFCSDLKRSYHTADIAFKNRNFKIIKDNRLRECNYGDLTKHPEKEIKAIKGDCIIKPYPNGESYEQTSEKIKKFLQDLLANYDGKKVMIIGHRATQYGLEHWIKKMPLREAVIAPWHWQPGWKYHLKGLK